ncbi:maleylpyruvate isomerase family mycothiol-dependent enzyme [Streptomyces broussonetiae]|uniref:Maleylpyruvate isomerase family mycothiol-dependent enzyme n=1 Tax=Streptomyces broussonetiae TaxID=2686304 RepID=A0A6I6MR94_9ACTN|nr:maleylpyruvate isomerase family mycothiol-dependent enzyme [Streptomyces broussonetiae]QHA03048.1 maleylpyruvate isomerase family mycothiol-dependent enzyme [Streptomyces broussonetiae]
MDTADFLETLDREGRLLAAAAEAAGADAKVPTCPEWQVRDLLRHTGAVHRWATGFVAEADPAPRPFGDLPDLDGAELVAWYRDSHRLLVDTLAAAPAALECWTFLPASGPSPLAFWTRRQAHETTVHRYDAEAALGGTASPVAPDFAPDFAVDGIDELLRGFHARSRSRLRTEEPRVVRVRALAATPDGTDAVWTVRLSAEPPVTVRDAADEAEAELSGPAEQLYLALWNREPVPSVTGDRSLAELWREKGRI